MLGLVIVYVKIQTMNSITSEHNNLHKWGASLKVVQVFLLTELDVYRLFSMTANKKVLTL